MRLAGTLLHCCAHLFVCVGGAYAFAQLPPPCPARSLQPCLTFHLFDLELYGKVGDQDVLRYR